MWRRIHKLIGLSTDTVVLAETAPAAALVERRLAEGLAKHQSGDLAGADAAYRQILADFSEHPGALQYLGVLVAQRGEYAEAERLLRRALAGDGDNPALHVNLGNVVKAQGSLAEAAEIYRHAIALDPLLVDPLFNLGNVLLSPGRFDEAILFYDRALALQPELAAAHNNRAFALNSLGRHQEAADGSRRALALDAGFFHAHNNLGNALKDLGRLEDAVDCYRLAIGLQPEYAEAHNNLGNVLKDLGRLEEAVACFDHALKLQPDFPDAVWNLSLALLTLGDFERGWKAYEQRFLRTGGATSLRNFPWPRWKGEELDGKTILIHAEQGFGDALQFVRYIPLVAGRGGKVVLEAHPELFKLFSGLFGADKVVARGQPMADLGFDYHCPLMSLPYLFGTRLDTIPNEVPYLSVPEGMREEWRERIGKGNGKEDAQGMKIGLVWSSNVQNQAIHRNKSMPLKDMQGLDEWAGVTLYSLQKGEGRKEIEDAGLELIDYSEELVDFSATAALIANLDLVITVDTAVAHLAGALGKPVWMLVWHGSDWRWMLEREDSPWYPGMRLFRQPRLGDWASPMARICAELGAVLGGDRSRLRAPPHATTKRPLPPTGISAAVAAFVHVQECRHGTMCYLRNDRFIGRSLELYGEYSEAEAELFAALLHAGDVVVEAGANIGAHTVCLARAVGEKGRVIAYEPQPVIHELLCANIGLNALGNVQPRRAGLGAKACVTGISPPDYRGTNNFGGVALNVVEDNRADATVKVEPLDSLELDRLDLLKVDVEGMEIDVIKGAAGSIERLQPMLYIENDRAEHSAALIGLIRKMGYRLWWHTPPLFNPGNYLGNRNNVFGNLISANMLCIPGGSKLVPPGLKEVAGTGDSWRG